MLETQLLEVISEVIEVTLDDQGDSWDTKNKPKHQANVMLKYFNYNQKWGFSKKLDIFLDLTKIYSTKYIASSL